jgi:hypothetical protein
MKWTKEICFRFSSMKSSIHMIVDLNIHHMYNSNSIDMTLILYLRYLFYFLLLFLFTSNRFLWLFAIHRQNQCTANCSRDLSSKMFLTKRVIKNDHSYLIFFLFFRFDIKINAQWIVFIKKINYQKRFFILFRWKFWSFLFFSIQYKDLRTTNRIIDFAIRLKNDQIFEDILILKRVF